MVPYELKLEQVTVKKGLDTQNKESKAATLFLPY